MGKTSKVTVRTSIKLPNTWRPDRRWPKRTSDVGPWVVSVFGVCRGRQQSPFFLRLPRSCRRRPWWECSNNEHCRSFFPLFPDVRNTIREALFNMRACKWGINGYVWGREKIRRPHSSRTNDGPRRPRRKRVCVWHMELVFIWDCCAAALLIAMLITAHLYWGKWGHVFGGRGEIDPEKGMKPK